MTGSWSGIAARVREERLRLLHGALLYFICDARPRGRSAVQLVAAALDGGADIVQLRDKHADDETLGATGEELRFLCARRRALFVMNDRPDLAVEVGADGVHVGQTDASPARAREIVGDEMLIGLSTHSTREIEAAAGSDSGCDYIGVGTVFHTSNRPRAKRAGSALPGLGLVRYAASHYSLPFFAIGGIDPGNVERVIDAGGRRVAVIGAVRDAPDPAAAARSIRRRLEVAAGEDRVRRAR